MDKTTKCVIPLGGLAAGTHRFGFRLGDAFFGQFEGSGIRGGDVDVEVVLKRGGASAQVDLTIAGLVRVECDRCLEECSLPVDYGGTLTVRSGERSDEEPDGEVMWIGAGEDELDLSQYVYESVVLALPYRRIHPDGADGRPGCDADMLARFRIVTEEEFEALAAGEMQKMEEHPQWERLREIKEKL